MKNLIGELDERLSIGKERYGHGVRVDDDTTTWGTKIDSWLDMAKEEFLDAIIYLTADYIRSYRDTETGKMGPMEIRYMEQREKKDTSDNDLIMYIIRNWQLVEPCRYKTVLCSLISILDLDPVVLRASPSDSEPDCDTSSLCSDMSLSSLDESEVPF